MDRDRAVGEDQEEAGNLELEVFEFQGASCLGSDSPLFALEESLFLCGRESGEPPLHICLSGELHPLGGAEQGHVLEEGPRHFHHPLDAGLRGGCREKALFSIPIADAPLDTLQMGSRETVRPTVKEVLEEALVLLEETASKKGPL